MNKTLLLQLVSQEGVQELFQLIMDLPYPVVSRTEFQFCCLRIRFVSPGVGRFRSVGLEISWTFLVIFFNFSWGSTLFISLYMSFSSFLFVIDLA
jgi:hypothetical protein